MIVSTATVTPGSFALPDDCPAGRALDPPTPFFAFDPSVPMSAEILEHWAAKLVVRGCPGDAEAAQKAQAAAEEFRAWQKAQRR